MAMEWIRLHPYASILGAAGIVIVLGTILVVSRAQTAAPTGVSAWSGNTAVLGATNTPSGPATVSHANVSGVVAENYGTQTLPYTQNVPVSDSQGTIQDSTGANSIDFNAFIAELTQGSPKAVAASSATSTTGESAVNQWPYIPSGLISIVKPSTTARSAIQQSLYLYGNEVGSYVSGYDASHTGQAQTLSDANNDRQNPGKQAAVEKIGQDLETIGQGLAEITDTPATAAADNSALAASYTEIGKKLVTVGQSEALSDSALVAAVEAYDSSMDTFNKNYLALAYTFSDYGVTFTSGDPGSVFSFTTSSL